MSKIKVGVLGAGRGSTMIRYCSEAENAELVAICDGLPVVLEQQKKQYGDCGIAFYDNFDEFIKHDMDAVVLANCANEHAPFAIKAMKAGKHVFSEVMPVQTMKEAVELIEAVEETGMIYAYGENFCYMPACAEMKKLYQDGKIGEFEYGEGEYIHNCEGDWHMYTRGEKRHWRNNMYSTFYCTHSVGPMVHITGLRPVKVVGLESSMTERIEKNGAQSGLFGIEMITFENGGIMKSIHGGLYLNSHWFTVYGSKGRMESAREVAEDGGVGKIYLHNPERSVDYDKTPIESYLPAREYDHVACTYGHGGSDFYCMYNFIEKIKGNKNADIIDVYEAMDMFLPGLFAYRSILQGGTAVEIPDLRIKEEREKWRGDVACTQPEIAGDQLLPPNSFGKVVDDSVYENMRKKYEMVMGK